MTANMFLSRVAIDIKNQNALRALSNPEILHGMIETSLPREHSRCLWRVDELGGRTYLLLMSEERPDLFSIANQIGSDEKPCETKDYQPLLNRITVGSIWRFRLVANPVVSQPRPGKKRGKLKAITIHEHQREWLTRQAEKNGFILSSDQFDTIRSEWRTFRNKSNNVSILQVTFEGLLTVSDAAKFQDSLLGGIGRGKAYGMGLLTVMTP